MTTDSARSATHLTRTLFAAQSLSSAATVAIFPIVAIAGAKLSGQSTWAGVPAMAYQLGGAFAAFLWGRLMDPLGRRSVLAIGMLLGATGSTISAGAIIGQSFWTFFGGAVLVGMAVSAVQLSRFVSAEVHPVAERARAISTVVLGGTVGAIFGPLTAGPMGRAAASRGLDELAGPYGASIVLFLVGTALIVLFLRPEPRDLARALTREGPVDGAGPARTLAEIYRERPAQVATAAMLFGQLVMVMLMVITPLHMRVHQHAIGSISFVISAHVVGMYAFSIISGRLADRWGRLPVIITGGAFLILACLAATLSPEVVPLSVALFLLGLGWNLCYVGGSSLLSDQLSPPERARTQGFNDLLVGLASAAGSLGSGIVFAGIGYNAMGLVGTAAALIPLTMTLAWWSRRRAVVGAS
jgi:MFS family permease